jgi:hypothetical protein
MSETHAAATTTDAGATPPAEGTGAQIDPLEAALAEFNSETAKTDKPDTSSTPADKPKIDVKQLHDDAAFIREERERLEKEAFGRVVADTVKAIKGDIEFDDELVEGWLSARAGKEPRIAAAFASRGKNPDGWKKVLDGLRADFAKKFADQPDRAATDDRNAVRQAMRGASSTRPPTPAVDNKALSKMNDAEFERFKAGLGG